MLSRPSSLKLKSSIQFESLGTHWFIEAEADILAKQERLIHETLDRIDRIWSRFRDDSLVSTMANKPGEYTLSAEDIRLMQWYRQLYEVTDGSLTPLVGQTLADAGYDASYSLTPKATITSTPSWDETIRLTTTGMAIMNPVLLDVGAAGKGFAIDAVSDLFDDTPYTIDAGGDMRLKGDVQSIGLEHPTRKDELIGMVTLKDKSICGSAGNRRQWGDWHHIINPKTSRPVRDIVATWAIADTAMHADGIASALFFLPPEQLSSLGDFSYIIMYENGEVYHTDTHNIQLFT